MGALAWERLLLWLGLPIFDLVFTLGTMIAGEVHPCTPINEMYVTARMSALDSVWNEQLRSDDAFVRATCHLAKASVLMMQAIQRERADAVYVNSESSEFYQACCPNREVRRIADFENERRFIALDLMYGVPVRADVYAYLIDHGMSREEYQWFMDQDVARRAILGVDYYEWNEKLINSEGRAETLASCSAGT